MTSVVSDSRNPYIDLVEPDRIHGSIYTDPEVFEWELEQIWACEWIFVGHDSQVPEPGDYVKTWIGRQPAVMTRDKSGAIHVLLNRCAHRGAQVCDQAQGNSSVFRCPYHGWTFSNTGALLGYPYNSGYGGTVKKSEMGLGRAMVATYRGFVFARLTEEGPTLEEHLGLAAEGIDRFVEFSPVGELQMSAGFIKHDVRANWKILLENETDGYHPGFVHSSIFSVVPTNLTDIFAESSLTEVRDLGNGHTELDARAEYARVGSELEWLGSDRVKLAEYVTVLEAARGVERAAEILRAGPPHVMVFPNLFLAELSVHWFQPVGVDRTIQHGTVAQFKGAPSFNRRIMRKAEGTIGPAGLLQADDSEMYERVQRGLAAHTPEWAVLKRGLHREHRDAAGALVSNLTDETSLRGIWSHYRKLLERSSTPVSA
jgi:phenylpropionate dioxygenase-like ring-hydroxylating dioxygenase large terminal subunit